MLAWLAGATPVSAATADDPCPVCGKKFGSGATVFGFTKRGREEKIFTCGDCAKLETTCYICGVPVKDKMMQLADGRLLCNDDTSQAVLTQDDAEKLFDDVKRDIQSLLSAHGTLPHRNIHLTLEAKARLDKSGANLISAHDDRLLMGLTRTTSVEAGKYDHTISLLYGLTHERMMVVAAHEYAHAWLHENVRRRMNQDAVEGFCDWIAYKMITQKNSPYETKVLLDSDYSQGQLQAFIAAENEHSFYRVIQWTKLGIDPEIDPEHLERIVELRTPSVAPREPFVALPAVPRVGPTNLVLKGLSGSKTRRFALINDGTFALNEQGKVRVGESNVVVRCLEIHDNAVKVRVADESEIRTLVLKAAK